MAPDVVYPLVQSSWRASPLVSVQIEGHDIPINVPVEFLARSGDNTWRFVKFIVNECVNETGDVVQADGQLLPDEGVPRPGKYVFVLPADSGVQFSRLLLCLYKESWLAGGTRPSPTFAKGPQMKSPVKAPKGSASESTVSKSSRSTQLQVRNFIRILE
jgi:hypothetical protein